MKLYLLSQTENTGYDTYASCVVAARSIEDAVKIHPSGFAKPLAEWNDWCSGWAYSPEKVNAEYIGEAARGTQNGVICASFNADRRKVNMQTFYRGDIYYIEPYQTEGSEQRAGRPAIIVSNDMNNNYSNVVEVVYLTTQPKSYLPTHVKIRSASRESTALCEQITSVSKERVADYFGEVMPEELKAINEALAVSLAIESISAPTKKNGFAALIGVLGKIRSLLNGHGRARRLQGTV